MDEPTGRREANKRATRTALQQAAQRLFADRGFAATTVREIADAAGVTERTFFRYFAGKEELVLDDVLAWLPGLQAAIRSRPTDEPPLVAVIEAVKLLLTLDGGQVSSGPLPLFAHGRPIHKLGASALGFLLRIETAVADAVLDRLNATDTEDQLHRKFEADVTARISLALFRSAMIRDVEMRELGHADHPSLPLLFDEAAAIALQPPTPPRQRRRR